MPRLNMLALFAALLLSGIRTDAAPPGPLPRFELVDLAGKVVKGASLVLPGRWLLFYGRPGETPSEDALGLLDEAHLRSRQSIRIALRGTLPEVERHPERFRGLDSAEWFADPEGAASKSLGLSGTPVVLGVEGETLKWTLSGSPADVDGWKRALKAWVDD